MLALCTSKDLTEMDDLDLMRVPITDAGTKHLVPLTKVRQLILRGTYSQR